MAKESGVQAVWLHEARRCRPSTLALPLLSAAMIVGVSAALSASTSTSPRDVGIGMVRLTADLFPVTAGLAACVAVGGERLVELHGSLPTPYPRTVLRRLLLVGLATLVGAIGVVVVLGLGGHWRSPASGALAPVVPMAPAIYLGGVAVWAQAILRSTAAASTTVVAAWLAQLAVLDRWVTVWQINRPLLISIGVGLTVTGLRRFADGEAMLVRSDW
ncbi:hypothetical protein [Frankia sp. R82]|uniref:hypothetical protein n=1 Tax=Frankia sp. R82 TaxID=2950553 RepID=UPI0020440789|nr:hypothetical protein [Frankia sp. R82]MCM3886088.1 hypothetical protein [Frankia sp. R82]